MDKATSKYFERQMAGLVSEAKTVLRFASEILEDDYKIPRTHYQHQVDITVECIKASPGLVPDTSLLVAMGEAEAAAQRIKAALATLKQVDAFIFDPAPSVRLLAYLTVGGVGCDADSWTSAVCGADFATGDDRRRRALDIKRKLHAAGDPIPTEADAAPLLGRDEARAEQFKQGGGARCRQSA